MMSGNTLEASDFDKLLSHAETMTRPLHYKLLIWLMMDLGLRPIELAKLDASWFRGKELVIPSGQSKRKRPRTLRVRPELLEVLGEHLAGRSGRVFVNRDGEAFSPAQMSASVRRLFREAGVLGSCYSARRTVATRLVDKGANILVVQAVLGHSNPQTTLNYVSVTQNMIEKALYD